MKPIAVFALASVALAGSACSESPASPVAPAAEIETVSAESEVAGTLNLSVPGGVSGSSDTGGTLNLNVGGASNRGGLIVGAEGFGGGDFGEPPSIEIDLDETSDVMLETDSAAPADDIVRLPPPK